MDKFKIKKKKEINRIFIFQIIYCFLFAFSALFIIYFVSFLADAKIFSFKHFIIFSLCAIPLSILYAYTREIIGSILGGIFTGWTTRKIPPREQLSADLAKARYAKGSGHFQEALSIINQVLEKDPDFPDALYLKAHILWEGFNNSKGALEILIRVMELVRDDESIYHWASSYYHEVKKGHII
jgi:tetratricopeptide (TPR) repeat protein